MNFSEDFIRALFLEHLDAKVIDIENVLKRTRQKVKIVTTDKGKYIFKHPKNSYKQIFGYDYIFNEWYASSKCLDLSLPAPKVLFRTSRYLVEEFIEGYGLDQVNYSEETLKKIYFQVGAFLKKMHSIRGKGSGFLSVAGNRFLKSRKAFQVLRFKKNIKRLEKGGYLTGADLSRAEDYFYNNSCMLSSNNCINYVLIHNDLGDYHVLVKDDRLKGIIDFGDAIYDVAARDFGRMYIKHYGNYRFEALLDGYGPVDIKEIEFYAFLRMTMEIPTYSDLERLREVNQRYKEIIYN